MPTLMRLHSDIVCEKHQLEFEQKLCEEDLDSYKKQEQEKGKLHSQQEAATLKLSEAKEQLDCVHRNVFARRKKFVVTHRRLTGKEKLPSGELLSPSSADVAQVLAQIRSELQQGTLFSLQHLADTDCADLMFSRAGASRNVEQQDAAGNWKPPLDNAARYGTPSAAKGATSTPKFGSASSVAPAPARNASRLLRTPTADAH